MCEDFLEFCTDCVDALVEGAKTGVTRLINVFGCSGSGCAQA